jgi:hypothetical protein
MADPQVVTSSDRPWSTEVGIAEAQDPEAMQERAKRPVVYEFSGGHDFREGDGPYANPAQ